MQSQNMPAQFSVFAQKPQFSSYPTMPVSVLSPSSSQAQRTRVKPELSSLNQFDSKFCQVVTRVQKIPKASCSKCMKQYMESTLAKRNGICGHCNKKLQTSDKQKTLLNTKISCYTCKKPYLKKTLDKHNGICGKCARKTLTLTNTVKSVEQNKVPCGKCSRPYTTKTLEKYSGICGKCNTLQKQGPIVLPPPRKM